MITEMDYQGFANKWNNRQVTAYQGECVALVAQYCVENGKPIAYANAKDWANHPALRGAFTWIENNPNDFNQLPKRGDIIIFGGNLPGSGGYGHIEIFWSVSSPGVFIGFSQNWGGRHAHFVSHNYNYVLGWWTVNAPPPTPQGGTEMIENIDQARQAYRLLRGDSVVTDGELNGTAGRRSWAEFASTAMGEVDDRENSKRQQAEQLQFMQNTINQLNQTITNLQQGDINDQQTQQNLKDKIAELTTKLETQHDKIVDIKTPEPLVFPEPKTSLLTKLLLALFKPKDK